MTRLALSVRQPWAQAIVEGDQTVEHRSFPTRVRCRVYIYDFLDELDDWRVVDFLRRCLRGGRRRLVVRELDREVFGDQLLERDVAALEDAIQDRAQLVVLDDDRVDRHRGLELDLVEHLAVRRVGDRHHEAVAALAQRQHAPLAHQLAVDRLERERARVERFQVGERQAEDMGGELGDVEGRHLAALDELLDEPGARLAGLDRHLFGDVLRQPAVLDHGPGQAAQSAAVAWIDRHPPRRVP